MAGSNDGGRQHELPAGVIQDLDDADIYKTFEERTDERQMLQRAKVLDPATEDLTIAPMQWPMLDDGKKLTTNAYGYPTGGWYALQKHKEAAEAAAREAEAERQRQEEEAARQQEEEQHVLTVQEIENLRQEARDDGFKEGHDEGFKQGYQEGLTKGQEDGFQQGHAKGAQAGLEEGRAQGRQQGFIEGQQQGIEEGTALVNAQAERFRRLADMLANPLRELDQAVTDEIIYLISRLTRVILKRELKGDGEFLKHNLEQVLSILPNAKEGAVVRLNPEDLGLCEAVFGREYMQKANWQLTADDKLNPGDVEVENEACAVTWRIDERIDALLDDFLKGSAGAVNMALREHIDGAPEFDEVGKAPLAPPPVLSDFKDEIAAKAGLTEPSQSAAAQPSPALEAGAVKASPAATPRTSARAKPRVQAQPMAEDLPPIEGDPFADPAGSAK